jgi:hypothetical protein
VILAIRNIGRKTCRMSGYPRVTVLGVNAQAIPTTVDHHGGSTRSVVIGPWQRAFFDMVYTVNGPCQKAVFADGLQVNPVAGSGRLVWYMGRTGMCGPAPAVVSITLLSATRHF